MAEQSNQPGIKDLYKVLSDIEQRHDAEVKRLTEEKQKLETSLKNEIETTTEQSKRLQNVEGNLIVHKEIINSLREELQVEKRKLDAYQHQVVTLTEEKQKLETSLKNEIETTTTQSKRLQNVEGNLIVHKEIINSTLKEQENLKHELKEKTDEVTSLHYAKRNVELTIDVFDEDNKRLTSEARDLRNTSTKEKKRIEELIKDIKAAKQEIAQLQRTDTAYKKKLKEAEQKLTRTGTACKKTLQEAEQKLTRAHNEKQTAKDELKRTATAYKEELQEAGEILIRAHNVTQTAKDALKRTATEYKEILQEAELNIIRLQSDLAIALKDRDDYQVRLSVLMSTKLTTNNPEITDLSDINRPTKLAEQWSELYDNEYTELFEALQCDDEKKIPLLLKLLKRSFEICQEIREQGVDWLGYCSENNTMHNILPKKEEKGIKEPLPNEDPMDHEEPESASSKGEKNKEGEGQENPYTESEIDNKADDEQNDQVYGRLHPFSHQQSAVKVKLDVPNELKHELMLELSSYRKKKALAFVDILNKKLPERVAKEFDMAWNTGNALDMYLKSCIRLCWLMGIQSPPVYIRFDEHDQTTRHAKLDKHFYREYTKAGQYIDYVVWPPIELHKDGPLLHRGVAQGTDSKDWYI